MATADSLTVEFECPVCNEVFKQPKVVGSCLHTLCRGCIQKYVTVLGRRDAFPCPVCRENCAIPNDGVDGLKDNFHLSSIIEQYFIKERSKLLDTDVRCDVCQGKAKTLCKTCDSINLCSACTERHNHDPKTRGHEIIGLCSEHDKPMSLYCKDCKCTLCSVCKLSEHSLGDHDISPHRDVLDNALLEISAATAELESAVTRVEVLEEEVDMLYELVKQKSSAAEDRLTVCADRSIKKKEEEKKDIGNERLALRKQIDRPTLRKRKAKLDARYGQVIHDVDKLKKQKDNDLAKIRKPVEKLEQCRRSLDTRKKAMRTKLRVDMPEIMHNVETLHDMRQSMLDLTSESNDPDTVALIEDVKKTFNTGRIEPCLLEGAGTLRNPKGSLKSLKSASFPSGHPCHQVHRMRELHDGRVAILGRSSQGTTLCLTQNGRRCSYILTFVSLYIHDPERSMTSVTAFDVKRASDIAVTSAGEILVVYQQISHGFSLLNIETGQTRSIDTSCGKWSSLSVCSVETDEADNMFIHIEKTDEVANMMFDLLDDGVVVFTPRGDVIGDKYALPPCLGGCKRMSYCKRTGILYIAEDGMILRYFWNGLVLNEFLPNLTYEVPGFQCTDIVVRNGGNVVVIGKMEEGINFMMLGPEIRVCEVVQAQHKEDAIDDETIHFHCKMRSHWIYEWNPNICRSIHDNQLWLGCGSSVELCETITVGKDSIMAHKESFKNVIKFYLPFKDSIGWKFITCHSINVCLIALFFCLIFCFKAVPHFRYVSVSCENACLALVGFCGWVFLVVRTTNFLFNDTSYDHLPGKIRQLSIAKQLSILSIGILAGLSFLGVYFIYLFKDLNKGLAT